MSHVPGDKYILYLPPAKEDWDALDKSLCLKIERQFTSFQTDWGPSNAFDKDPDDTGTEHIYQIKHDRGTMRAFAGWWQEDSTHVLCIICLYKRENQDPYWSRLSTFDDCAARAKEKLSELHDKDELVKRFEEYEKNEEYRVVWP